MDFPQTAEALVQNFTKDQLIEAHRLAYGNVGDTARTPKSEYAEAIARLTADQQRASLQAKTEDKTEPPKNGENPDQSKGEPDQQGQGQAQPEQSDSEADQQGQGQGQPDQPKAPSKPSKPLSPLEQAIRDEVDKALAEAEADGKMGKGQPSKITIKMPDLPPVDMEGPQHPLFEKVLRLVNAGVNVLLVGPAGCGKSYLCEAISYPDCRNQSHPQPHGPECAGQ